MKRISVPVIVLLVCAASVAAAYGQQHPTTSSTQTSTSPPDASRDATREKVRAVLTAMGPKINVEFKPGDGQPYNFVGVMKTGLKNTDSLEIVISVTAQETIHFRIYPHYNGSYINVNKAKDVSELARKMLRFGDSNFLYWGADASYDVFAGYNFTLESGFPEASFRVVLGSIANLDEYVRQLRPAIDGTTAP